MRLQRNLGNADRVIRWAGGVALLGLAVLKPLPLGPGWQAGLAMLGIFMLAEAATGY